MERYKQKRMELDELAATLDELRQRLDGKTTASYAAHVPRGGDGRGSLEARAVRLADMEEHYMDALDALAELRPEVETELDQVKNNLTRELLELVYVDGMTVRAAAHRLGITERHGLKLKAAGLNHLREVTA